jgi:serine/threonine-protein kinase
MTAELADTLLESDERGPRPPAIARAGERRYEPIRVIGRGGLGEVSLVHDRDIDRAVAIKRLRADASSSASAERFADEIRTVGQLEHPNIAPIHDVGVDAEGNQFFVMRYIAGETLEQVIAKLAAGDREYHRRYTFEYRTQIFLSVLHAIHFAHARGVVHRDLKPANIMVGPFGEVVVMDWGVAKKRSAPVEPDGALVGTPAYMAPEQALGRNDLVDERTDIYSLCAVFYELLALRHYLPNREALDEMVAAIIGETAELAGHVRHPDQSLPPAELAWFIEKGLRKDAAQRYQSLAEMIEALQIAVAGQFRVQCYVTLMKRTGAGMLKLVDARPRVAVAGCVAALGLAATGLIDLLARLV